MKKFFVTASFHLTHQINFLECPEFFTSTNLTPKSGLEGGKAMLKKLVNAMKKSPLVVGVSAITAGMVIGGSFANRTPVDEHRIIFSTQTESVKKFLKALKEKNSDEALKLLESVRKEDPVLSNLADIYIARMVSVSNQELALQILSSLEYTELKNDALVEKAKILIRQGKLKEAKSILEKVDERYRTERYLITLSDVLWKLGKKEEAWRITTNLITQNPSEYVADRIVDLWTSNKLGSEKRMWVLKKLLLNHDGIGIVKNIRASAKFGEKLPQEFLAEMWVSLKYVFGTRGARTVEWLLTKPNLWNLKRAFYSGRVNWKSKILPAVLRAFSLRTALRSTSSLSAVYYLKAIKETSYPDIAYFSFEPVLRRAIARRNYRFIVNAVDHLLTRSDSVLKERDLFWGGYSAEITGDKVKSVKFYEEAVFLDPVGFYGQKSADGLKRIWKGKIESYIELLEKTGETFEDINELELALKSYTIAWVLNPNGKSRLKLLSLLKKVYPEYFNEPHLDIADFYSPRYIRFKEFAKLGAYELARRELERLGIKHPWDRIAVLDSAVKNGSFYWAQTHIRKFTLKGLLKKYILLLPDKVVSTFYPVAYMGLVKSASDRYGIDPALILAVIRQESLFIKNAVSRAGARGLMQLMPSTARILERSIYGNKGNIFEPERNITLGTAYLKDLIKATGSVEKALASYNGGIGRLRKTMRKFRVKDDSHIVELLPFGETRNYVALVMSHYNIYRELLKRRSFEAVALRR